VGLSELSEGRGGVLYHVKEKLRGHQVSLRKKREGRLTLTYAKSTQQGDGKAPGGPKKIWSLDGSKDRALARKPARKKGRLKSRGERPCIRRKKGCHYSILKRLFSGLPKNERKSGHAWGGCSKSFDKRGKGKRECFSEAERLTGVSTRKEMNTKTSRRQKKGSQLHLFTAKKDRGCSGGTKKNC